MVSLFYKLGLDEHIIGVEQGYVNSPSDRGGETNHGITHTTARRYGYTGPMRSMPRAEALRIYEERYFKETNIILVALASEAVAKEMFDTGVNMGVAWPGIFLQTMLNRFNRRQKDYLNVKIDGDVGPATVNALKSYLARRGKEGERVLVKALNVLQGGRYVDITPEDDLNEDNIYGWFRTRVT